MAPVGESLTPRSEAYRERVLSALRATAVPVELPRFWDLIESLGWGTRIHDRATLAREIAGKLGLAECLAFDARLHVLDRELELAISGWELQTEQQIGLHIDLVRDLRQHLIGLGRAEYEAALRNPAVAKQRGEHDDYLEAFGLAFDDALHLHSDEVLDAALARAAQPFSVEDLREGMVVTHPEHGLGVVREEPWANRYRASFRAGDLLVDRRSALV